MKRLIRKTATPFGALVAAVVFLIIVVIVSMSGVSHAANSSTDHGRLITIHDRGVEKVILSEAATIGDALKEAGISIDAKDVVEPTVTEKLIAPDYQVNIYRARPVIIVDGNIRQKVMTPYQTAEQIAASANITLYPEDKTSIDRVDNLVESAGLQLTITRATPFILTLYGKTATARTQGKTVGEMLTEKGIILGQDDRVSPSTGALITDGLAVRVWREGKQTISVDEPVDFDIQKIENADQPVGYLEVQAQGVPGLRSVTYEVVIQDGKEVSRTEIASVVLKQATTQIEVVGVKGKYTTPTENENITWSFLINNGFSRSQAAGIMGNLMQEHHFNTTDTAGGLGIVQWTSTRRSRLISEYPDSYTNIYSQLNFLMEELNGSRINVLNRIKSADQLSNVVEIFQDSYEGCGVCMYNNRLGYAEDILGSH